MLPEDIDDLFRDGLDGHATPPDPALWNRLADAPDRLDELFRTRLTGHATPPGRALWERLEDEHLRPPRKRRGAAWWPLAVAAVVALLVAAGGAGLLWRTARHPRPAAGLAVGAQRTASASIAAGRPAVKTTNAARIDAPSGTAAGALETTAPVAARTKTLAVAPPKNIFPGRATAAEGLASSGSSATKRVAGRFAAEARRTPARLVATGRPASAGAPAARPALPTLLPDAGALAVAPPIPAAASADAAQVIEVEVRRGGGTPPPAVVVAASAGADDRPAPRRLLGGLLRQAGHLARGERMSLAEATGLPETLTLQANLGGHTLTRSIQL